MASLTGDTRRVVLAVTGASGTIYAQAIARAVAQAPGHELHLIFSGAARKVMELETDFQKQDFTAHAAAMYDEKNIAAAPASGSWPCAGMIVAPCSMASLAAIASGLGSNLIHRAADVQLKEGRPLVLVPRETPMNRIHLENMLRASEAGARIVPACPGFYHRPESIQDVANHLAGKILDQLDVPHSLYERWQGAE